MSEVHFVVQAVEMLRNAGHKVTPTDIPGLVDIEGIGSDFTLGQLRQIAAERGAWTLSAPFKLDTSP